MCIRDRRIFVTKNPEEGWSGSIDGRIAKNDTYVYKINYELREFPISDKVSGKVTLVR